MYDALRTTQLPVVFRGVGSPNGQNYGAAVCILEYGAADVYGLIRLVQISESQCWVDCSVEATADSNQIYMLAVREFGNFNGDDGCGEQG